MHVCFCCVLVSFSVLSQKIGWEEPKWPNLCRVWRKNHNSVNQSLQCFDAVGWVKGRTSGPWNTRALCRRRFFSAEEESRGDRLTQVNVCWPIPNTHTHTHLPEKQSLKRMWWWKDWVNWVSFTSHPTQITSFWRRSSQPISWLSTEKRKQTQQKQTCIRDKIYYNVKLAWKIKARFSRLLRLPTWKRNRSVLEGIDR